MKTKILSIVLLLASLIAVNTVVALPRASGGACVILPDHGYCPGCNGNTCGVPPNTCNQCMTYCCTIYARCSAPAKFNFKSKTETCSLCIDNYPCGGFCPA